MVAVEMDDIVPNTFHVNLLGQLIGRGLFSASNQSSASPPKLAEKISEAWQVLGEAEILDRD